MFITALLPTGRAQGLTVVAVKHQKEDAGGGQRSRAEPGRGNTETSSLLVPALDTAAAQLT